MYVHGEHTFVCVCVYVYTYICMYIHIVTCRVGEEDARARILGACVSALI